MPDSSQKQSHPDEILKNFRAIENKHDLLSRTENGISWWELVRYDLHDRILIEKGEQSSEKKSARKNIQWFAGYISSIFFSLTTKNPLRAPRDALIFIGHPRKKQEGNKFVDIYTDPVLDFLPSRYNYAVMERPFSAGIHYRPALNQDLLYLDALLLISAILREILMHGLSTETRDVCRQVQQDFSDLLDVDLNIENYVKRATGKWRSEMPLFRWLFGRLRPRAVIIVVSTGNEALVAAARSLNIPTAELQHGAPSEGKLNYDYPKNSPKKYFPDFFLSFGKIWTRNVSLPLPPERIISLGFPYMQIKRQKYRDIQKKRQIVVFSQPKVAHVLSGFARDLAVRLKGNVPVLYKIHPQEQQDWETRYRELEDAGVILVDNKTDLYQLLAESNWQAGIYSTALYEGLAFSCRTFIVNHYGAKYMKSLIEGGFATLVDSVEEINLESDTGDPPRPELFPEVTPGTIADALQRIITGGRDAA